MVARNLAGLVFFFASVAGANVEPAAIEFTNKELQAAYILVRPELSQMEFHGMKGKFDPAPAIKFFGVEPQEFEIDLSKIGNILDLRFYHLRAKMPELRFENKELIIEVPLEDNSGAFRSALGWIGCRNASMKAYLKWTQSSTGQYRLVLKSVTYKGTLIGSGVFRSGLLLRQTKKLLLKVLQDQLEKMLKKSEVQLSIQNSLLQWGRVTTGETYSEIVPGTLDFFQAGDVSGVRYQVQ